MTAAALLFDGGLGTHLESLGYDLGGPGWSGEILAKHPEVVQSAHADFFAAGAQVATTASYQITHDLFGEHADELLVESVQVARRAARTGRAGGKNKLVVASAGSYGAGPGPGTEYDGAFGKTAEELRAWHERRLVVLADAAPDAVMVETVPSLEEIKGVALVTGGLRVPVMLSLTVRGNYLGDGTPLVQAAQAAATIPGLVGLGVNCATAVDTVAAMKVFKGLPELNGLLLVANPNSGEYFDAQHARWINRGAPGPVDLVEDLIAAGAGAVGGCCRVGPTQIAAMAAKIT